MTDLHDGRRYDDEEVSLILRRAAELQEARTGGTSLDDLESVAREAGLDPAFVRQAALEMQARGSAAAPFTPNAPHAPHLGGGGFLGAPTVLRFERVVPREVPPEEYDVLVDEMRRALNDVGTVSALGRTLAWSTNQPMRRGNATGRAVSVTIVSRNGRTVIRAEEALGNLAGGLFGGIMGGGGGGSSGLAIGGGLTLFHSLPIALGIWGVVLAGTYGLARAIFGGVARKRATQLATLVDRLAELAESGA